MLIEETIRKNKFVTGDMANNKDGGNSYPAIR
jgi:hypothetical protein